jgi:hypothetical protein
MTERHRRCVAHEYSRSLGVVTASLDGRFESLRMIIPTDDEGELVLRYLHRQRELVVVTAEGLTDDQARWTPDERRLPIIGIINHLTHVEWRWIQGRYLRHPFPPRHEEFALDAHVSLAEVVDASSDQAEQSDELVRAARNLEVPCMGQEGEYPPAHVLLGLGEPTSGGLTCNDAARGRSRACSGARSASTADRVRARASVDW